MPEKKKRYQKSLSQKHDVEHGSDHVRAIKVMRFLEHLQLGWTVSAACRHADLDYATAYRYRREDEVFAEDWNDALEIGLERLEDAAMARAVEGVERPVFGKAGKIGAVQEYSNDLLKFLIIRRDQHDRGRRLAAANAAARNGTVNLDPVTGLPRNLSAEVQEMTPEDASRTYQELMKK